jgi:hypothetical protein
MVDLNLIFQQAKNFGSAAALFNGRLEPAG